MEKIILEGYRGSRAHGTYIPPDDPNSIDDIDYMGIYVKPMEYYLGFGSYHHRSEVKESFEGNVDKVCYELRRFMHLASRCNPNVLSILYNRREDYTLVTLSGQMLIDNRELFLARKSIYDAFGGYARSQLHRMTHIKYEGYMGAKRKKLAEKYGYDCKNASHCVRLLKIGTELLLTGHLKVYRDEDRQLLMDIKTGKYALPEVQVMAEKFFKALDEAYHESTLPMENNIKAIENLMITIINAEC